MEFVTELSKDVISTLGKLAVLSTMKQFDYVIHHKNIISKLKEAHGELKGVKEAMQAWVGSKEMNREGIEPNIQKWLNDMEAFENVLQRTFNEEEVKKNEKCFGGKCPNLANNYSLGKRAAKGIEYIARLKEEKKGFQFISYHKPPPTVGSTFTEGIKSLKSRMMIMNQVIEKLKDDKLKRISICGMGGVGKTTLAYELIKYVENTKLFDKVVMAVVSQNPDYKNIQSQIADCLGMRLRSESVEGRGREIIQKLKEIDDDGKTKVLVVLDDVWSELNFDKVGLPSRDDQKCIKIIFTSRHEKECQKMGSQMNFDVSVLVEDEAWYLFQAITGDVVYEPDIYPIAKQVSRECRDLPLAIVIVGKALKNEKKLSTWEVALEQLKNSQSSTLSIVYSSIKLSLNFLGSIHKKFLMLCGLFPEDFDIPIESLSRHATGLGLFKVDGDTWKTINQVHSLVDDLKRCCLLLDSNVPGCVKMHDIVRDVVILVTFKTDEHHQFMVEYDMKRLREEKLDDINAISLILDDETIGLEDKLECPTLQLLQLQSKRKEPTQWPKSFFQGMKSLKVLSLQSLYIPKFSTLSQASVSLHTLQVEYCDVGDISIIGKELIHLKVLSFAHSNIKELPIEIGNLSVLRLLDLTNCNDLNVISANVLIRLSQLEELYLWMDNFPWIKNDVAMNELKQISHQLKVVEMKVREVEFLVMDLDLCNLQKFWIFVDPYTRFRRSAYLESNLLQVSAIDYQFVNRIMIVSHLIKKCEILAIRNMKDLKNVMTQLLCDCPSPYLKDLRVDSCPDLVFLIDTTVYCNGFPNIRSLSLKNLPNFKEMCYASNNGELNSPHRMQLFPKLETILLQDCSSINVVFDTHVNGQVFPQLKEIKIAGLHQLTHVWRSNKAMHCVQGFQNLKILTISYCDSLRYVFNLSIIGAITNIEELNIKCCKLMEYLVSDDDEEEEGGHKNKEKENIVSFEKLYSLTLSGLPSIACVCTNSYEIQFPSLRKLEIDDCPKLDILVFLTTSHSSIEEDTSFNNCEGNNSRSSNWQFGCTPFCSKKINKTCSTSERRTKIEFKGASLLQELNVKNCDLHQCLVIDSYLYSNLKSLTVRGCDRISVLLSFPSMRCLEQLEKLDITECKNLNEIVCQEESEANGEKIIIFPALQDLILKDLPKLKAFFHGPYNLDFPSLQKVSIFNCPNMEVFSGGVSSMPELKDVSVWNELLDNYSIHKDDINVTIQQFKTFVELQKCEMLNFKELLDKGMFGYFIKQKEMKIINFQRLSMLVPFSEIKMLQHVRKLFVSSCDELIEVFESVTEKRDAITHYQLQEMTLYRLPRLSRIWNHNNIEVVSFKNLTKLKVNNCPNLKSLLSYSMARSLVQLQTIEVSNCEMMEEIITKGEKYIEGDNKVKTLLPKLEELRLSNLPKLECVCSVDYDYDIPFFTDEEDNKFNNNDKVQILFPELKKLSFYEVPKLKCFCSGVYTYDIRFLSVEECPNMRTFPFRNVIVNTPNLHWLSWDPVNMYTHGDVNLTIYYHQNPEKYMVALQKLKTFRNIVDKELIGYIKRVTSLDIVNCHNLLSCIPSNMMQLFSHLNFLIVKECDCLEEIFETNDYMLQCELWILHLFSLPKLKHIWKNQGGQIVGFKCLELIIIDGCNDLEHVFPDVSVVTSLPNLHRISVYNCEKMKKIIGNNCNPINYLGHNAKIKFPKSLKQIGLVGLPSLECFGQSNFPCYVEMSNCNWIWIEDCPKMKTFWHDGILYTPNLDCVYVDARYRFKNEDVNEVIQRYYK
ncbi:hypothetical protein P8452_59463 [Trifolium repens]|nr:hypothetical protein P8452_59463 [Trifolium repens]